MQNTSLNATDLLVSRHQDAIAGREVSLPPTERVYTNYGNVPLIHLLKSGYQRVLDIGCGAGDNAALIKSQTPKSEICGITHSAAEAERALTHMEKCWVIDIEAELPEDLQAQSFDVLIFSHVLEHLRNPDVVLARFSRLLHTGGQVLIAIPNILSFKMRLQFLRGDFQYQSAGVMDDTHLHFYTYFTADRYLLAKSPDLSLSAKSVSGFFPLWVLRGNVLSKTLSKRVDDWAIQRWPNLFGHQVLIRAVKE